MKNYLIIIRYKVPIETIDKFTVAHRAYLKTQYDAKRLLVSGPFVPRTAGALWAQAPDRTVIDQMIEKDPFKIENLADYEVFEYSPTMHAPVLDDLFASQIA